MWIGELRKQIAESEQSRDSAQDRVLQCERTMQQLKDTLDERSRQVEQLQSQLAERSRLVESRAQELDSLKVCHFLSSDSHENMTKIWLTQFGFHGLK